MKIAVIPARGGSKRIPRKNIKNFAGLPLIAYSIQAAKKSGLFDHIIVSTDDDEIAQIAQQQGADVPFMRPASLSDDHTATVPVIAHAIEATCKAKALHVEDIKAVCCIYATAPFLQPQFLQNAYQKLISHKADFVFSATTFAFPIQRAIKQENGKVGMFYPQHAKTRSQDLQEAYHDAGQFYFGTPDAWLEDRVIFGKHSVLEILPRHLVQDIDTPEDFKRAQLMYQVLKTNEEI